MNLGIVGSEADRFSPAMEEEARIIIARSILDYCPDSVISGGCHLGGVDIWAAEIGRALGCPVVEHFPTVLKWGAAGGFRDRNLRIAKHSDLVIVVAPSGYISTYNGKRFNGCRHCATARPAHVRSGGCWTAMRCARSAWEIIPVTERGQK